MEIRETINEIITQRHQHLPKIDDQLERMQQMSTAVTQLDTLIEAIKQEMTQGHGTYFNILSANPKMEWAFKRISTTSVHDLLKVHTDNLDNLKKRFSRRSVCIAMIGFERQGKSTFLQAISGLSNKVIPAYAGTSCTGAVSVIHNIDDDAKFRAEVTYYTVPEFIDIIQQKLERFFPGRQFRLNSVRDLTAIDLSGFKTNDLNLANEYNKFVDAFRDHIDAYERLLGSGTQRYTDEDQIIQHVAQFELFDTPPQGEYTIEHPDVNDPDDKPRYKKHYYKYIAVKSVNIYKQFDLIDSSQIELVDTIGMGDSNNKDKIEAEMFRVLREDCDAAVDVFKPDSAGTSFNVQQTEILNKISSLLGDRDPGLWIMYVLNKVTAKRGYNANYINDVYKQALDAIEMLENKPVAEVKMIDGSNVDDVRDNLVKPLLKLISTNLPALDSKLMEQANASGAQLAAAYLKLVNEVEAVLAGASTTGTNEGRLFDQLYAALFAALGSALRVLWEEYDSNYDKPCPDIDAALKMTLDDLYDTVPDQEEIMAVLAVGAKPANQVFSDCCSQMITKIRYQFQEINDDVIIPLRDKMKARIATCLYETGRLSLIPLKEYAATEDPDTKWMECLARESLSKDEIYRPLLKTINDVIDYDFSIKYTIEDDVTRALSIINPMRPKTFMPCPHITTTNINQQTDIIWQELINRIPRLQESLKSNIGQFSHIPSRSFFTQVANFRDAITRDDAIKYAMKEYYRDHRYSIWKQDFSNLVGAQAAFGNWNTLSQELSALYTPGMFTLK